VARVLEEEEPVEDSGSNEGSDGRGGLAKFSTLKVVPPKGAKLSMGQANTTRGHISMGERPTCPQRLVRIVGEEAKKRLE